MGRVAISLNPYVAGNPVGDNPASMGRADVLREAVYRMLEEQGLDRLTSEEHG